MCNELSHLVISSSKQVQLTSHNSQLTFDSRKPIHSHLLWPWFPRNQGICAVIDRAYRRAFLLDVVQVMRYGSLNSPRRKCMSSAIVQTDQTTRSGPWLVWTGRIV